MSKFERAHDDEWQHGVLRALEAHMKIVAERHQFIDAIGGADSEVREYMREVEESYARLFRHLGSSSGFGEAA